MTHDPQWAEELRTALSAIEASMSLVGEIHAFTWENLTTHDAIPRELPLPLAELLQRANSKLASAREAIQSAFRRYSAEPVETVLLRRPMSREQYFLLLAMGATREEIPVPGWLANESDSSSHAGYRTLELSEDAY
jgi:hypothetical protein